MIGKQRSSPRHHSPSAAPHTILNTSNVTYKIQNNYICSLYMSWTQLYFSPWHVSFFSSPYMTLIKPWNLKCIWMGLVRPFNSSGEKDHVVQNPIKQSGRSCIWWSPGGHIIGSKWGNKNRTENCSQCAGKDSKKRAKLPFCVDKTC